MRGGRALVRRHAAHDAAHDRHAQRAPTALNGIAARQSLRREPTRHARHAQQGAVVAGLVALALLGYLLVALLKPEWF